VAIKLAGKALDDLVYYPLSIGEERLQIEPNEDNELYDYNGMHIHYQIREAAPEFRDRGMDISADIGWGFLAYSLFDNKEGKLENYNYAIIDIWDAVLEKYRDIIFIHELVEIQQRSAGTSRKDAHQYAIKEHEAYMKKYLSKKDQKAFRDHIKHLKKAR